MTHFFGNIKWRGATEVEAHDREGNRYLKRVAAFWILHDVEPHVVLRLKRVFRRIAPAQHGVIRITDTEEACRELEWFMGRYPMRMKKAERSRLEERAGEHEAREERVQRVLAGRVKPREIGLALPPRDYQRRAIELALTTRGLLLADDLGLGKTCVGLGVISEGPAPAVVVTPTHLQRQWAREIERFLPGATYHILRNGGPYELLADRPRLGLSADALPSIIILNYAKVAQWADTLGPLVQTLVYDEVQELRRGEESAKGRGAYYMSQHAEIRLGLSATPIYNYGGEIHAVLEALRPGALGDWSEFSQEWCTEEDNRRKSCLSQPAVFGEYARSTGLLLRRTRKDVGRELPALTRVPHQVSSDTDWLTKTEDAATELARIIIEGTGRGEAFRAAGELELLLRQASGIAKAPYVAEFVKMVLEGGEQKVVLAGWHRAVYQVWLERLAAYHPLLYTGSESVAQKDEAQRRFLEDRSVRVLILSLRSGAGLDGLQTAARTVIYGELDWSPGVHEQCSGRLHRDGQKDPVCAYYLWSEWPSIDPSIMDTLGLKHAQILGLRDPSGYNVEGVDRKGEHLRRLAERYYEMKGDDGATTIGSEHQRAATGV